jgi:hypothetical protein
MQAVESGPEELAVVHRKNLRRRLELERRAVFLERFYNYCRAGIRILITIKVLPCFSRRSGQRRSEQVAAKGVLPLFAVFSEKSS